MSKATSLIKGTEFVTVVKKSLGDHYDTYTLNSYPSTMLCADVST